MLYRFRTYDAEGRNATDSQTVHNMLDGMLAFASIENFNDPFEGRPQAIAAHEDASEQRKAFEKYIRQVCKSRKLPPGQARKYAHNIIRGRTQAEIVEIVGTMYQELLYQEDIQVCCFSGEQALASPLTWAHYADSHRGVAIHYDGTKFPIAFAQPVRYSESYPQIVVPRTAQDPWDAVVAGLLTKSKAWDYEWESRLLRINIDDGTRDPRFADLGVRWLGQSAILPAGVVTGITLGARMSDANKEFLTDLVTRAHPDMEILESSLHRSKYEIGRHRIR